MSTNEQFETTKERTVRIKCTAVIDFEFDVFQGMTETERIEEIADRIAQGEYFPMNIQNLNITKLY